MATSLPSREERIATHRQMMAQRAVPADLEQAWIARAKVQKEYGLVPDVPPWAYQPYGILRYTPELYVSVEPTDEEYLEELLTLVYIHDTPLTDRLVVALNARLNNPLAL